MMVMRAAAASALLVLLFCAAGARAQDDQPQAQDTDDATVETEEVITYQSPTVNPKKVYFAEHFDNENTFKKRWVVSEAKKEGVDDDIAKYKGTWEIKEPEKRLLKNDLGLVLTSEATHAAVAAPLDRVFEFKDKPLIVQYEVTLQEGQSCGGAYLKLLSLEAGRPADRGALRAFNDRTPYSVMFGPDKCGSDHKLHFIFRHRNPVNGSVEEKHCNKPKERIDDYLKDKSPHLYTLVIRPDNTFSVSVDGKEVNSGSLLEDFTPPVNPPDTIDDPLDTKPADWDEREMIPEPDAQKPADWDDSAPPTIPDPHAAKPDGWLDDEPLTLPDLTAVKPADWDDEMDGAWEPPRVDNPACAAAPGCGPWQPPAVKNPDYKGPWRPKLVANPNYRGKWSPRRIPNPHYFKDDRPFQMTPIYAVGFELWSISPNMLFDNVLITDDPDAAAHYTQQTFTLKQQLLAANSERWVSRVERALGGRAGWWGLYALYVAAPVAAYVAYLARTARESVWGRAGGWLADNPWAYVLLALLLLAGGGFFFYWLCSEDEKEEDTKKTDGYTADDVYEEGEGGAPGGEGEGEPADEGEGEPLQEAGGEDDVTEPGADESPAADSAGAGAGAALVDADGGGDGHRKRRARRD